jgi:hypothetical protein
MPRKKEGLGPAFSCRLHEAQDRDLRAEAKKKKKPLVTVLRQRMAELDERRAADAKAADELVASALGEPVSA